MGNQREIRQVAPREGLGVVIPIRPGCVGSVSGLLGDEENRGRFYKYICLAGQPLDVPNLDGPNLVLGPLPRDRVAIQSGGKMWCGYESFVECISAMAPFLEDALFFVGDEVDYIDEFRLQEGKLHHRRVHEGYWRPVDDFIRSTMLDG